MTTTRTISPMSGGYARTRLYLLVATVPSASGATLKLSALAPSGTGGGVQSARVQCDSADLGGLVAQYFQDPTAVR
jgi:hypothetical protein